MFEGARKSILLGTSLLTALTCVPRTSAQAPTPGQNVNMVSGTKWPGGDPFLQRQNEPSIAVSTRNPQHLLAGANDYRTVDLNLVDQLPINQLSGDAWLGVFKSFDGGQRWQSTLLPGFPQDQSTFGASSPMKGFAAASDPTVRAGTNGMFYYSGIALNRNTNIGGLFLARFIDLNNKENGDAAQSSYPAPATDPIRYLNTVEIDAGNAGQFIDKPWIAVDIPRSGAGTCTIQAPQDNGTTVTQTFPGGNVYIAYAMFVGGTINVRSKINFSKSSDCGATWTKPIMISQTYDINQGTQVAVDPETGYVYVAWRVFSGSGTDPDAIVVTESTDGGNTFTKAVPVRTLTTYTGSAGPAMFDQNTSTTEFRDQTMPAIAVDDSGVAGVPGKVYVAWAERGVGPSGDARIQISTSSDGVTWSAPMAVDNNVLTDDSGSSINGGRGHQLMPAMTFIGGKLMIMYYDLRLDATTGVFTPHLVNGSLVADAKGQFFEENRPYVGDPVTSVFTPFVDDKGLTVRRHTMDVMVAQSNGGLTPSFTTARVSRYDFGLPDLKDVQGGLQSQQLEQLKVNPPNLPMFSQGTVPFMGDYLDVAGQMFVPLPGGGWTYNNPVPSTVATSSAAAKPPAGSPVYYGSWTSNQDVIPPADGNWTKYFAVPLPSQTTSIFNGQPLSACLAGWESDRNQNIYESRITQGLLVSSPQNSKPLSTTLQRAFVILVQNSTNFQKTFQLSIANQPLLANGTADPSGFASFQQALPNQPTLPSPLPAPVAKVNVAMGAHSGASRTVFALSSNPTASITINVNEVTGTDANGNPILGGLSSFIVLNADGTVPSLTNPDGVPTSTSIAGVEIYDPNITAPNITAPNITAPNITAPNITAPNITAPNITAPNITATNVANPNITAPNITAGSIADATYTVTNTGNTNAEYHVKLAGGASGSNAKVPLQLTVNQVYTTPTSYQCTLIPQQQNITFVNVLNPEFTPLNQLSNPNITAADPSDATIYLAPGDSALITLRGQTDIATMQSIVTQIAPVVVPQAVDTNSGATTPTVIAPLFITTPSSLPDGVASGYSTTLSAIGGNLSPTSSVGTWTLIGAPTSLSLSAPASFTPGNPGTSSVILSGNPAVGTYTFTAQVQDSASPTPNTATRQFTLRIAAPLVITTASPLATATQGISYGPVTFSASGGTGSYSWTSVTVDGLTLNSSGVFSGIPTATGTFTVNTTVTDSASPSQTAMKSITLSVVPATAAPATGTLLCNSFNADAVTQQAGGPPSSFTCLLSATKITQLATYHYNNGAGATPGTVSIQRQDGLTFGPFTATGVAGQGGANEAWVATPNVIVPAGTYKVIDSGLATWSYNTGSNNAGFMRLWGFAVGVPTFTATQTGSAQWTYTLTFAPLVNYSIFPVATSSTNPTTITVTGLSGVTSAAGPTSTDFPVTVNPDLNAVNLNWSAQVLNNGTKVIFTHVGPGTGNFAVDKHAFGFTINATGAMNGTAQFMTSGFSRDTSNPLPDGTFNLDITDTTNGPTP